MIQKIEQFNRPRILPPNLRSVVRSREGLNRFHLRVKHQRAQALAFGIRSLVESVSHRPLRMEELETALFPLAQAIMMMVESRPDSLLSISNEGTQMGIPAKWLPHLSNLLQTLNHPLMKGSHQGRA